MAFLAGLMLLDAPAAALNNAGANLGSRYDNAVATKVIRTRQGAFPYVSAQAFRYWLRTTIERSIPEWKAAPVFQEPKVAYTDGNPIRWWDDDLFGYMRAQSKRTAAADQRAQDPGRANETTTSTALTRVSPFRVSTFVSIAPSTPTDDYGTMSRHDGDPVPHEHQFYHTTLKGLFSLDLHAAGTFSYRNRTGFRNLDENRRDEAEQGNLIHLESEQSYQLPSDDRIKRVAALLEGMGVLMGGAKHAIHYTDVVPAVILAAVLRGGNNPLQYTIGSDSAGLPLVNAEAVAELFRVWDDQILSPLYVGWTQGFHDGQRVRLAEALETARPGAYSIDHPREALNRIAGEMGSEAHASWLA